MFLVEYNSVFMVVDSSGARTAWENESRFFKKTISEIAINLYDKYPSASLIMKHVLPTPDGADWILLANWKEANDWLREVVEGSKATHIVRRLSVASY